MNGRGVTWGAGCCAAPADLYQEYKRLQKQLEFLQVQEDYIKDEQKNLKREYLHAQEEVKRIQSVPLVIGQFNEAIDENTSIVSSTTGKLLQPGKALVHLIGVMCRGLKASIFF